MMTAASNSCSRAGAAPSSSLSSVRRAGTFFSGLISPYESASMSAWLIITDSIVRSPPVSRVDRASAFSRSHSRTLAALFECFMS